jgi:hypothetical protein
MALGGSNIRTYGEYSPIQNDDMALEDIDYTAKPEIPDSQQKARLSFRQIWTLNVITTLSAQAIFDFHMG